MTLEPLTARQREVLDFIQASIREKGVAPTLVDICQRFDIRALSTVWKHLDNLAKKGYLRRRRNKTRGIELLTAGRHCPTCTCPAEHGEAKPV